MRIFNRTLETISQIFFWKMMLTNSHNLFYLTLFISKVCTWK